MKTIKYFLYIALLSVVLLGAELLLSEVLMMYQKDELKNNLSALEILKNEANKGSTNAAFLLASAYKNGKAGVVDLNKAIYWYKVASENGDADAMLMLGWLYYKQEDNLRVNLKKARYWFQKAASHGVDEAVEMLEMLR